MSASTSAPAKRFGLQTVLALIALIVAIGALGFAYWESTQVASLQSQSVNVTPVTRNVRIEWEATLPSFQDRWLPQYIIVNQGDSINLVVESNDTDGAHTWTINAPTGAGGTLQLTQLNTTVQGQWIYYPPGEAGPQYGHMVTGPATGCQTLGTANNCNTTGGCSINMGALGPCKCVGCGLLPKGSNETSSIQATVTIGALRASGVYQYYCTYHQAIGMVGYLVVLPNRGYGG